MAQNGYGNDYHQPGLEVAPDGWKNAPQVAMAESSPMPQYVVPGSTEDAHYHQAQYDQSWATKAYPYPEAAEPEPSPQNPGKPRRKFLWWAIGGVVLLLVIIGGVVGGLYGSGVLGGSGGGESSEQSSGNDNGSGPGRGPGGGSPADPKPSESEAPSSSSSSTPSTTASLQTSIPTAFGVAQSIRRGSALAATSWTKPDGATEVYLFHQDADNGIRYSRFDDGLAEPPLHETFWEEPVMVVSAEEGSRFSATLVLYNVTHEPQVQLYYSGPDERLLGMRINQQNDPPISEDIINKDAWNSTQGSAVAAYWPWVTFLNEENVLMETRNTVGGNMNPNTVDTDARKLGIRIRPGSGVAMVPMLTDFRGIAHGGGYGLVYRDLEGYLTVEIPRLNERGALPDDYPRSWPTDFPSIKIDEGTPIAAFSVARSSGSGSVNSYILYRDGTDIRTVSTDGSSWKQSRPEGLRGVDLDSQIACITMGTSHFDSSEARINLARGGSSNKCYFQKKGSVREVVLEDDDWVEVGIVPIP